MAASLHGVFERFLAHGQTEMDGAKFAKVCRGGIPGVLAAGVPGAACGCGSYPPPPVARILAAGRFGAFRRRKAKRRRADV